MNPMLTIAMPCYNTEAYLDQAFDSVLDRVADVEIVAVDDGSTDGTWTKLQEFAERYPGRARVFHQENAGWGGAINHAVAEAKGTFLLVLDSDDHLDTDVLNRVIAKLHDLERIDAQVDLLVTNFVYDHVVDQTQKGISYRNMMPQDTVFTWDDIKNPSITEYFMIHAMTYRTQILRDSNLKLPEHAAYMDSIFAMHPLPYVRNIYYFDVDLYYYLIGREGQSIEIDVLQKHIDEQLLATRTVIDDFDYETLAKQNKKMADTIARYLSAMMTISTLYLFMINTPEAQQKAKEIWAYLKSKDPKMHRKVYFSLAGLANRRTPLGKFAAKNVYMLVNKVVKFA